MRRLFALVLLLGTLAGVSGCGMQAYDLPLPGKVVKASDGYRVTADFADVVDVVPRTLVMANDVPVGQVDDVKRVGWHAEVTMTIRKDIVLPANAVADVRQTSLLGEKYISLSAPDGGTERSADRLADGAHIALDSTARNPEVEEVLGALSSLLAGGGVGQLKTISTELNKMMDGRTEDIRAVFSQIDTLVGALDRSKDSIVAAMTQVDRLSATLNRESDTIGDALDSFGPAITVLHQQHHDLMNMLQGLDNLGTVATRVIDRNGAQLTTIMKQLRPTLARLAEAGDSLPRGLMMAASFPFPKEAETLAMGDYSNALFHMEFDLDKLVKGLATGSNTGLPQVLQLCSTYSSDCNQLQPLVKTLCKLTGLDFACSMVGKASVLPSSSNGSKAGTVPPARSPGAGAPLLGLTGALLGGGSSGGSSGGIGALTDSLLGGLLGGGKK